MRGEIRMININELIRITKKMNFDDIVNDKVVLLLQVWVDKNRNLETIRTYRLD